MNNKEICSDYTEDFVWIKRKQHRVCTFYNLDVQGSCKHANHNTCPIYYIKKGIDDQRVLNIIEEFDAVIVPDQKGFIHLPEINYEAILEQIEDEKNARNKRY